MRTRFLLAAVIFAEPAAAMAQSSNSSSNSSSNNGVVRERIVDTYCDGGVCDRSVIRRIYRDDRARRWRAEDRRAARWSRDDEVRRRYRSSRERDDDDD